MPSKKGYGKKIGFSKKKKSKGVKRSKRKK